MLREHTPLVWKKKKGEIVINIAEIFRNHDIQRQVIKNIKKYKQ